MLLEELKGLIKHSFIYGIGNILNKAIAFFLIPIYTHYLTTAEYGILELVELVGYIIGMFLGLGISQSLIRFYYECHDSKEKDEIVSSSLMAITAISVVVLSSLTILSDKLSLIIFKNSDYKYFFKIMLLTLLFSLIGEIPLTYLRIKKKSILYTIISLSRTTLSLIMNIIFIVVLRLGVVGILLSGFITNSINCIILCFLVINDVKIKFSIYKVIEMIKYGLPFIPGGLGMFILNFGDRFFLQRFSDLSEVGIYSLGYKFGMVLHFLIFDPFMMIWSPKRIELAKAQANELISKVFTYFCFIEIFMGLCLSLLIKDILSIIVSSEFHAAYKVVPIIVLSYVFLAAYFHTQIGILMAKKTKYIALIVGTSAIINIGLCRILIPYYHSMGAAIATLIAFGIMFLMNLMISNSIYSIKYEFRRITKMLFIAIVLFTIFSNISIRSRIISILINGMVGFSFPLILWMIKFYEENEIRKLKDILDQIIKKIRSILKHNAVFKK